MKAAKQNYNVHEKKCIKIWKKREKDMNHLMYMETIIFIFQIDTKRHGSGSLQEHKTPTRLRTQSLRCFHDHPDRKRAQESIATCFPDRTFPSCLGETLPSLPTAPLFLLISCFFAVTYVEIYAYSSITTVMYMIMKYGFVVVYHGSSDHEHD